jgi:hypothetical protein
MKTKLFAALVAFFASSAYADSGFLVKCEFLESASVSFGYSSVYTFTGEIKDAGERGTHYYEMDGDVHAAVDQTPSTNFPGKHLGDTLVEFNNHPWGGKVLIDIASKTEVAGKSFRILIFPGASDRPHPVWSAYKISSTNGTGLAGGCEDLDPRLQGG